VVAHSDDSGFWKDSETKWLWTSVSSGGTRSPTLTVQIPSGYSGVGEITATLKNSEGDQTVTSQTIIVERQHSPTPTPRTTPTATLTAPATTSSSSPTTTPPLTTPPRSPTTSARTTVAVATTSPGTIRTHSTDVGPVSTTDHKTGTFNTRSSKTRTPSDLETASTQTDSHPRGTDTTSVNNSTGSGEGFTIIIGLTGVLLALVLSIRRL